MDKQDVLFAIGGIGVMPILPMIQVAGQRGINWRTIHLLREDIYTRLFPGYLV